MPSVIGHTLSAFAIGQYAPKVVRSPKFWGLAMACSLLPDLDVLSFRFGIPYDHLFGHRGFTHSFFFAFLTALTFRWLAFRRLPWRSAESFWLIGLFFLLTASHPILDALTNGGRGVAFWAPFDNSRHFFSWRPIVVSPLGWGRFFSEWGWRVIRSEMLVVGVPTFFLWLLKCMVVKGSRTGK